MWLWNQAGLCSNPNQPLISYMTLGKVLQSSGLHISKMVRVKILPGAALNVGAERPYTVHQVLGMAHIRNLIKRGFSR